MRGLKRSHKLTPEARKQKIAEVVVPKGWDDPDQHILLSKEAVLKICGLTDSSFSELRNDRDDPFPAPHLYIRPRQPRWLGSEVAAWLQRRREKRHEDARLAVPSTAFKKKADVECANV